MIISFLPLLFFPFPSHLPHPTTFSEKKKIAMTPSSHKHADADPESDPGAKKALLLAHMQRSGLSADVLHGLDAISFFRLSSPLSPTSSLADTHAHFRGIHIAGMRLVLNHPRVIDYAASFLSTVVETRATIVGIDGNLIPLYITSPKSKSPSPRKCVLYLHSGAMGMFSTTAAAYRAWCRLLARDGLRVVAVDFRNCVCSPTMKEEDNGNGMGEAYPFPAGLNDCVYALKWLASQEDVDSITVVGESGGANLALGTCVRLAKQCKHGNKMLKQQYDKVCGVVSWDPYVAGPSVWRSWSEEESDMPSLLENNGAGFPSTELFHMGVMYTPEEKDWTNGEAWPLFLTDEEVDLLPKTVVHTSGLDSLRSEGDTVAEMLEKRGKLEEHVRHEGRTHTLYVYGPALGMVGLMEAAAKSVAEKALRAGPNDNENKMKKKT